MNGFKSHYRIWKSDSGHGSSARGIFNSVDRDFYMCSLSIKINIGGEVASDKQIRLNVSFPDSYLLMNEMYQFNIYSFSDRSDNYLGYHPFSMIQYVEDELLISWESDYMNETLTINSIDIGESCYSDVTGQRPDKLIKYFPGDENVVEQNEEKLFLAKDMSIATTRTPISDDDDDNDDDQWGTTHSPSKGISLFPKIIILSLMILLLQTFC